jgi:hypothetical protein
MVNGIRKGTPMLVTSANAQQIIEEVGKSKPKPSFRTRNRPIINQLSYFASLYNSARRPDWLVRLEDFGGPKSGIRLDKDNYISLLVSSVVQGFETYVKAHIWTTGHLAGFSDWSVTRINRLPRGTGTVDRLFNKLPGELHPDFPIDRADPEAATFLREFYRTVRNPLSHGDELSNAGAYDFLCFLEWYRRGYEWIAAWRVPGPYVEFGLNFLLVKEVLPNGQAEWDEAAREFRLRRATKLQLSVP